MQPTSIFCKGKEFDRVVDSYLCKLSKSTRFVESELIKAIMALCVPFVWWHVYLFVQVGFGCFYVYKILLAKDWIFGMYGFASVSAMLYIIFFKQFSIRMFYSYLVGNCYSYDPECGPGETYGDRSLFSGMRNFSYFVVSNHYIFLALDNKLPLYFPANFRQIIDIEIFGLVVTFIFTILFPFIYSKRIGSFLYLAPYLAFLIKNGVVSMSEDGIRKLKKIKCGPISSTMA